MTVRRSHVALHSAAALLVGVSLLGTFLTGVEDRPVALAFGILVAVGELTRPQSGPRLREAAPLGAAGSLSYALVGGHAGHPTQHGVTQVVAVVVAASLLGSVPQLARGQAVLDHLVRRVLAVGFAAVCFQPLHNRGCSTAGAGPPTRCCCSRCSS